MKLAAKPSFFSFSVGGRFYIPEMGFCKVKASENRKIASRQYIQACFRFVILYYFPTKTSMFLSEEEEHISENACPQIPIKSVTIPTYATQSLAPSSFNMGHDSSLKKSMDSTKTSPDVSLQEQIFKGNAELLRSAVLHYLKMCLGQKFHEICGSLAQNILAQNQSMGYDQEESILELIATKNKLLSQETQIKILHYISEFHQISSLFKQLKILLGTTLTQEFTFILAKILTLKFDAFKKLSGCQACDIIPQMERFWGYEGNEKFIPNGWEIYQDIDYLSIKRFAAQKIEEMASKIYYDPQLECLNFSQTQLGNVESSEKFVALVGLFSQTLFLSMSGIRQEQEDLQEFLQELRTETLFGQLHNDQPVKRTKLE